MSNNQNVNRYAWALRALDRQMTIGDLIHSLQVVSETIMASSGYKSSADVQNDPAIQLIVREIAGRCGTFEKRKDDVTNLESLIQQCRTFSVMEQATIDHQIEEQKRPQTRLPRTEGKTLAQDLDEAANNGEKVGD